MSKELKYPDYPALHEGTYSEDLERGYKEAEERAKEQERKAKRDRDMAIIGDMAHLFSQGAALHGGAKRVDKTSSAAAVGNEKLKAIQDRNIAQVAQFAKERAALREARRKENNAAKLAKYNAELEAYKSGLEAEKYANELAYKERKEQREIAESQAKIEREKAYANYYNSGKKGSGSNTSITLTFPDGTQHTFSKDKDGENWIDVAYEEAVKAGMSRRMNVKRDNLGNTSEYEDTSQRGRLASLTTWNQANREWTGWKDNNIEVDEDFE